MRDYRKLDAFQKAHQLVLGVYRLTKSFPAEERFGLTSQLRRASVSITSNIVEGSARDSEAEYRRFIEIAHASSWEVEYQIQLSVDLELCPIVHVSLDKEKERERVKDRLPRTTHADQIIAQCRQVSRMLSGLLQSLARPS